MQMWLSGFLAGAAFIGLTVIVPSGGRLAPAIGMAVGSVLLLVMRSVNGPKS